MSQPTTGQSAHVSSAVRGDVRPSWRPRIAPQQILWLGAILVIVLAAFCTWLALQPPWLGIDLALSEGGVIVKQVDGGGPSIGKLRPGDRIVAIGEGSRRVELSDDVLLEDPDDLSTFDAYNRYFAYQGRLIDALSDPIVTLTLDDERQITLRPFPHRPMSDLPIDFWLTAICGMGSFLIGTAVWAFRRGETATRILFLCGIGLLIAALATCVYAQREIALSSQVFSYASRVNRFGITLFGVAALVLQFYYPERLTRFPFAQAIFGLFALVLINEFNQWLQPPLHAFKMQFSLIYGCGFIPAVWQWRRTRNRPAARAALLWFLLAIYGSMGIGMSVYMIPYTLGYQPLISMTVAFFIGFAMFVGLALGVLRYRLFDLEQWWFAALAWFVGGLLVIATDAVLIYMLEMGPATALGTAVILVGWVYFPVRQRLWGLLTRSANKGLEHHVPMIMEAFFSAQSTAEFPDKWRDLLKRAFAPLEVTTVAGVLAQPTLRDDGMLLIVPSLIPGGHIELRCAAQGRRLFTRADVSLADHMLAFAEQSLKLRDAQERGARQERERIMRDLHDDVAAKLLTLTHRTENPAHAETARSALRSLREAIYSLDDTASTLLDDFLSDLLNELRDRLEAAGVALSWRQDDNLPPHFLTPRQRINLSRIVQESVTNALRHGSPEHISVLVNIQDGRLILRLCDDGTGGDPSTWSAGKGLNNIRTRTAELGGEVQWHTGDQDRGCCVTVDVPLEP